MPEDLEQRPPNGGELMKWVGPKTDRVLIPVSIEQDETLCFDQVEILDIRDAVEDLIREQQETSRQVGLLSKRMSTRLIVAICTTAFGFISWVLDLLFAEAVLTTWVLRTFSVLFGAG